MAFTLRVSTNILYTVIQVFSEKMEAFSTALLCSYGDLTRTALSVRMSTRTSKLFQPLPVTQFQSRFHVVGYIFQQHPHFLVPIPALVNRGCFNQVP